jgi:hypothetical protein
LGNLFHSPTRNGPISNGIVSPGRRGSHGRALALLGGGMAGACFLIPAPPLLSGFQAKLKAAQPRQPFPALSQIKLYMPEEVGHLGQAAKGKALPDHAEGLLEQVLGPAGHHLDIHFEGDAVGQIETAPVGESLERCYDLARMTRRQIAFRPIDRTGKARFDVVDPVRQKDARLVVPGFGEGNHPPPRCFAGQGRHCRPCAGMGQDGCG